MVRQLVFCFLLVLEARRTLSSQGIYKVPPSRGVPRRKLANIDGSQEVQARVSRQSAHRILVLFTFLTAPVKLTAMGRSPRS